MVNLYHPTIANCFEMTDVRDVRDVSRQASCATFVPFLPAGRGRSVPAQRPKTIGIPYFGTRRDPSRTAVARLKILWRVTSVRVRPPPSASRYSMHILRAAITGNF
jgi:hypothetical protein